MMECDQSIQQTGSGVQRTCNLAGRREILILHDKPSAAHEDGGKGQTVGSHALLLIKDSLAVLQTEAVRREIGIFMMNVSIGDAVLLLYTGGYSEPPIEPYGEGCQQTHERFPVSQLGLPDSCC
jgi:hypothetical protein